MQTLRRNAVFSPSSFAASLTVKHGAFISYQDFTSSALSAETVVIMVHNNGLEFVADTVLLPEGEESTEIMP